MTVSTEWFDELDGDNQSVGSLDTYVDVDGTGIQFNADQISSSNFDGGIPKSAPSNKSVYQVVPGDYVFWNISSNSPITKSISSDIDSEAEDDLDYDDSLYLVVDIEYDDTNSNPDSTSATRYLYLQAEDDTKRVSASGSSLVTVIRESDVASWDGGTTGWMLTSSGNAIFGNVYARGAIYAESGEISGDLSFGGSLVGTNSEGVGVAIYGTNPQISDTNNTGVINAIGTGFRTAFDANDIQTFDATDTTSPYTASTLRIQRLGGGLIIGNNNSSNANDIKMYGDLEIGSSTYNRAATIYGDLTVTGSITSGGGGTVGPGSFTTLSATGTVNFSTAGTITLGGDGVNVNISAPSDTSRALNVGGNVGVDGTLRVDTVSGNNTSTVIINDTLSVNGSLYADYASSPRFVSLTNQNLSFFVAQTTNSALTSAMQRLEATDTGGYNFFECSNGSGYADLKFKIGAAGNVTADGTFTGGGADYAEFFEWEDGNPNNEDRVGYSVIIINNKIQIATDEDIPVGVISSTPLVVGDSSWNAWNKKYLKDDYNRTILEYYNVIRWSLDGEEFSYIEGEVPDDIVIPDTYEVIIKSKPVLNPEYNLELEYVSREDRKEWSPVGLVGKLRLRKGQLVAPGWIKLRDISENVEEWLVR